MGSTFSDAGVEQWERPGSVPAALKQEARELREWLIAHRELASTDQLKIRLRSFLSHFWVDKLPIDLATATVADNAKAVEAGKAFDWIRAFSEFPLSVVDAACDEYLRASSKKPTIADLRGICVRLDTDGSLIARLGVVIDRTRLQAEPEPRIERENMNRISAWLNISRIRHLTADELQAMGRGEWPAQQQGGAA